MEWKKVTRCKLFWCADGQMHIDEQINNWIIDQENDEESRRSFNVVDIKLSSSESEHSARDNALVIYTEEFPEVDFNE